jgi:hypothetical protein
LIVATPDDHEAPVVRGGYRRPRLRPHRIAIHAELGPDGRARAADALAEDAAAAPVLPTALPYDYKAPVGTGCGVGLSLVLGRIAVHAELGSDAYPITAEALAEDSELAPVLPVALPHDNETPVAAARHTPGR